MRASSRVTKAALTRAIDDSVIQKVVISIQWAAMIVVARPAYAARHLQLQALCVLFLQQTTRAQTAPAWPWQLQLFHTLHWWSQADHLSAVSRARPAEARGVGGLLQRGPELHLREPLEAQLLGQDSRVSHAL
jgi:hypothetical protein